MPFRFGQLLLRCNARNLIRKGLFLTVEAVETTGSCEKFSFEEEARIPASLSYTDER